jgi:TonB family protein
MNTALFFVILTIIGAVGQEPKLRWEEFHEPAYPQMARVANINGAVTLEFTIARDGTVDVQKSAGHPMLVHASVESLKLSKLACDNCGKVAARFSVVFEFKIATSECGNSSVSSRALLENSNHVTVTIDRYCFIDPAPELTKKVRSVRCLYLWKCAIRKE